MAGSCAHCFAVWRALLTAITWSLGGDDSQVFRLTSPDSWGAPLP
jgi:hypothetical protein